MDLRADIDWERLDRWVRADGTPEELEALRRWVEADPELVALAATMRTIGRPASAANDRPWDTRGRWQGLQRQMRRADRPLRMAGSEVGERGRRKYWRSWPAAAAAIVVLTAGISFWAVDAKRQMSDRAVASAPMREIVARRGQRVAFDLPDGSRVVVAPESRLRIPATYRSKSGRRDVYLDSGDAFFTVEHNAARPFRVHTANGMAEDLGTEFLVTTSRVKRETQVVVVSGEVALWNAGTRESRPRPLLTLGVGDLGQLDASGSATVTSDVNTARYISWIDGTLTFQNTRLDEAIPTLARWYDLDIRLADSALAGRRVTATIRNQSASRVLESMALSLGLQVERKDKLILLSAEHR